MNTNILTNNKLNNIDTSKYTSMLYLCNFYELT